tara:strand:+ start:1030 stop:2328 length:1299 start_codon:yes stop_codon:yes gene_type:complete
MSVRAYSADRIYDGDTVLHDHAVIVEGDSITGLVKLNAVPSDLPLIRHPGCTIIPGLIDTHMHFMRWQGPAFLAYGVTTVRDTGNDLDWILQCREAWPKETWPRILCMGPLLDGDPPGHPLVARTITDVDAAAVAVRETASSGVDAIKLYASIAAEWIAPMVEASHAAGLKVSMHCLPHGVLVAGRAGVDEFYHLDGILADVWPDRPSGWLYVWGDQDFCQTWDRQLQVADEIAELGIVSTPTLAYWDSQWRRRLQDPYDEESRFVPGDLLTWSSADPDPETGEVWRRATEAAVRFQGLLLERDVPVLAGSDTPCGGILPSQSLWRELTLLVEAGLSPLGALRAATSDAADFCERPELGRLRTGSAADIAIVRGDLTATIPDQPEIEHVVRAGVDYDQPAALLQEFHDSGWRDDPWGRQMALHWAKRISPKA